MKVRNRILLLASLLMLVSIGGIVNLMWHMPRIEDLQDPKAILQVLILLGLFGIGLIFSVLELVRQEIRSPIFHLAAQIARLKERKIDGHRLEPTGSKDIDLLTRALNDLLDGFEKEENLYRIFAEASPDMIFLLDEDGCVLFCNTNAARQWNFQAEEMIGKRQEELFPPDIAKRHRQVIQKIFETGQPVVVDVHEKIGERHSWVDARMIPVRNKDGRVTAVLGISRDITARKQAEAALWESEARFRELFNHMGSGVAVYEAVDSGMDFIFRDFNPAAEKIEKASRKDIIGKRVSEAFPGVKAFGIFEVFQRVWQTGKSEYFPQNIYKDEKNSGSWRESWVFKLPTDEIVAIYNDITERKQAEEALKKSHALLSDAQRVGHVGSWELDIKTHALWWSDETFRIFGFQQGEFNNTMEAFFEIVHPDDRPQMQKMTEANWRERKPFDGVHRIIRPDGTVGVVHEQAETIFDDSGQPVRMIGTVHDITERKQAEKIILDLSKFPSENPSPVLRIAKDGKILYSNKPGLELLANWNVKIGEKAPEKWRRLVKEALESAKPGLQEEEEEVKSKIFSIIVAPVVEAGYVNLYARDITDRKKAMEALKNERRRLHDVLETMPVMVCLLTPDYHVAFSNRAFRDKFGESHGRHCYEYCFGKKEPCDFCESYRALKTGKPHHWQITTPDGASIIDVYDFPFADVDGSPMILEMDIDITDRRKAEKELHQRRKELFHMQRFKSVGELTSSLAHELNQPLAGILSNAQAAQRFLAGTKPDLSQIREILVDIVADDKRAGGVIHQLRALLRKEESPPEFVDINNSVRNVMTLVHNEAIVQNVSLLSELAEGLPQVLAGRIQIEQVILNLIMNAEQAMADLTAHKRSIMVSTVRGTPKGVVVSVRDTGPGIAKDKLEQIFEPFYTTKVEGLGLGLPICRSILVAHGGRIWAENNPDGGARFCFSLPGTEENAERGTRKAEVGTRKEERGSGIEENAELKRTRS